MKGRVRVDAEALIRPVVEGAGLEFVEVVFRKEGGRRVLRVTIDAETLLDVEGLASLSEKISRRLDLAGFDPGSYGLEVSSAGIEHVLRTPGQYRRALGMQVQVKKRRPVELIQGTLISADDEALVLATSEGEQRVPMSDVGSARTLADWDAELRRARR
jgi:ribosome maturation factor RimP